MPRKPRIEYAGAFYHVITRGNQKQSVFKDSTDFQKYLQLLTIYKNRTNCRIFAYVLMNNHVHLLIETQDIPLSKIMQGLNQTYTMHYNRRFRTVGHLFQGRYKAILCDREAYLLKLLKYIHLNPIRAKIAESFEAYPWSSHHAYIGKSNPLAIVDTDQVLRMFSENKARSRRKYQEFMREEETLEKSEVYATIDQRVQGDDSFVEQVRTLADKPVESGRKKKERSLNQIMTVIENTTGVSLEQLRAAGKLGLLMTGRRLFSHTARDYGYQGKEIAQFLHKDPAAVTGYCRRRDELANEIAAIHQGLAKSKSQ